MMTRAHFPCRAPPGPVSLDSDTVLLVTCRGVVGRGRRWTVFLAFYLLHVEVLRSVNLFSIKTNISSPLSSSYEISGGDRRRVWGGRNKFWRTKIFFLFLVIDQVFLILTLSLQILR